MSSEPEGVREFYDREAKRYDAVRWGHASGSRLARIQLDILSNLLGPVRGCSVLEVGVGTGRVGAFLAAEGARVFGVDVSREMLRCIDPQATGDAGLLRLVQADAGRMPLPDRALDRSVCVNVLSHAPDFPTIIAEVGRVLRPGGRFVFNFINAWSYLAPLAPYVNIRRKGVFRSVYTRWLSWRRVRRALRASGFSVYGRAGQTHLPRGTPAPIRHIQEFLDPMFRRAPFRAVAQIQWVGAERI